MYFGVRISTIMRKTKDAIMATLGENWKRQVPVNEDNRLILKDGIARRDETAAQWIEHVRQTALAQGIASCVSRGSDSLALPFPTEIVASAPLRSFMDTLQAEGLLVDVVVNGQGTQESLLLVTPV